MPKTILKYGMIKDPDLKVGSPVRYIPSGSPNTPGVILYPESPHEITAVLRDIRGECGYVELAPQLNSSTAQAGALVGSASSIRVDLPVQLSGTLKVQ